MVSILSSKRFSSVTWPSDPAFKPERRREIGMSAKMHNPGLFLAFGSSIVYCVLNVGLRFQLDGSLTVWGILVVRGLVGLAVLGLAAKLLKKDLLGRNRNMLLAVGLGTFLSTVFVVLAIGNIPLYQALVMLYLYPALTVPLNYFINSVKVRPETVFWVAAAFAGCVILIWPDSAAGLQVGVYHLAGLAGALFYALSLVLGTRLGEGNCGLEPIFYYSLWAFFGALAAIFIFGEPTGLKDPAAWGASLVLGLLALTSLLMAYAALRWLLPFKVGIVGSLEVFGGALSSWLIFDDPITIRAVIGGLIILGVAFRLRRS